MSLERAGKSIYIGIDVGSVSVDFAILDSDKNIIKTCYQRTHGQPVQVCIDIFEDLLKETSRDRISGVATTGSGGKLIASLLNGSFTNEIISQAKASEYLYPQVKTVIEMGGEDSKLILLDFSHETGRIHIKDFATNTMCAAGTGSFLDQQAHRLGISIEEEFSNLALMSQNPPRIAGRCSVFAKSDMIHLQQVATPDYDIVAGLCYAVTRNFKSNIAKGKKFVKPIAFQGGVAANKGVAKAFEDVLGLERGELLIHEYYGITGAIGATLILIENPPKEFSFTGIEVLKGYINRQKNSERKGLKPLKITQSSYSHIEDKDIKGIFPNNGNKIDVFLGIDIGSVSTNVVAVDRDKKVVARRYLMTAGRPIEAVRKGLKEVGEEIGSYVNVRGVGTTGSGRYLIGDFVGADVIRNEITAQAKAAADIDPLVDTIFEIGGQDSKYISISEGVVVDFEMNKVCAAGTGSFIEEQAERLAINIKEEFGKIALSSRHPVCMGERCTVFIESDLMHHQQKGIQREDLISGLSYSIAYNYLNRVVGKKKIGERIFFQGGVAANTGVVAAFETILNKKIVVPPHHDVTGAIGVALLAMENNISSSGFKGFDVGTRKYQIKSFECKDCVNLCEIRMVTVEGENPLFYGSRCEKFDVDKKSQRIFDKKDLFDEREELLFGSPQVLNGKKIRGKIGIPRTLYIYELYPFFKAFFNEIGFEVILSSQTNKLIIHNGLENVTAETCFPIKVAHGHILELLEKDIDYLFLPSIINMFVRNSKYDKNQTCPYIQAIPYMVNAAVDFSSSGVKALSPVFHFQRDEKHIEESMVEMAKEIGIDAAQARNAIYYAFKAQNEFYCQTNKKGKEFLRGLDKNEKALVIVSRPYNGYDCGINLDIPKKLMNLGISAIPMDFLPLDTVDLTDEHPNMYWKSGQRMLSAARLIKSDPRLFAVYITNFGCGPDSFITHFFHDMMEGKPFLQLEIDEHSADVGAITRCEAFLDSLKNYREKPFSVTKKNSKILSSLSEKNRIIFIPNMDDHTYAIKAAFEANNVMAEVIPESDETTSLLGRKFTSGKECYPCILTTGDLFKTIENCGLPRERIAFFMPSAEGPCRFGQYHKFQRLLLDENGYEDIPVYSLAPKNSYSDKIFGKGFDLAAWKGVVAIDIMQKALRETRPYEVNNGETDDVYRESIDIVCKAIATKRSLIEAMKKALKLFKNIPVDKSVIKLRIGIVGEIYMRTNRYGNQNIVKKIESLGGEAWVAPMSEWFLYTNCVYKERNLGMKDYKGYLRNIIKDNIQKYYEHKIYKSVKGFIRNWGEPDTEEILGYSKPYLDPSFDGEAVLSIGKSIDFIKNGMKGIINIIPFTCLPGTIVTAVSKKLSGDYGNIPWLNIAYDGVNDTGSETRLEAFMYQARLY
ncbi:MAG: hypothetical protein A3C43_09075 [Candidatus Schekmanbacteria bacterium RIFCSPHIGHO2_02_FULL_38_11]|nr:MAG: hypothetical protein A3C43_09075 [Candidatus Schekmanbacteria bacterium RIFCSPHIGHO2_02_FULL_38_11]